MSLESYLQKHPELTEEEYENEPEEVTGEPTPAATVPEQHKQRRGPWGLIVFLLILILFGVTCPSEADHREAVTAAVKERIHYNQNENNRLSIIVNMIGSGIANSYISSELRVHKYLVFSIGRVTTNSGEERTISLGLLNHVFTFLNEESEIE